jgi:hypothetical protein
MTDFYPASASWEGSAPERRSERLRTALRISADAGDLGSHPRAGRGRPAEKCDDTHLRKCPRRFASGPRIGFNRPITAEGAKLPGPADAIQRRTTGPTWGTNPRSWDTQSAGRLCEYAEAWTDGASRRKPAPRQVDFRYTARTAWTTGFRQSSPPASGKALSVPRSPRLVVRGGPPNESPISVRV